MMMAVMFHFLCVASVSSKPEEFHYPTSAARSICRRYREGKLAEGSKRSSLISTHQSLGGSLGFLSVVLSRLTGTETGDSA